MSCRTLSLRLDQLQLLPVLAGRACLELGLVHLRAGLERVGAALIVVVVVAVLVDVVAVLVVALVVVALVVSLVVARAVVPAVRAGVMVRPVVVVVAAARRVRLEVARRVALDLGL